MFFPGLSSGGILRRHKAFSGDQRNGNIILVRDLFSPRDEGKEKKKKTTFSPA